MQYAGLPAGSELAVVEPDDDIVQPAHSAAVIDRAKTDRFIALRFGARCIEWPLNESLLRWPRFLSRRHAGRQVVARSIAPLAL